MKMLLGFVSAAVLSIPVAATLKVADKAPDFSAKASLAGKEFSFSPADALKKGPVVVYFYPSAYQAAEKLSLSGVLNNRWVSCFD